MKSNYITHVSAFGLWTVRDLFIFVIHCLQKYFYINFVISRGTPMSLCLISVQTYNMTDRHGWVWPATAGATLKDSAYTSEPNAETGLFGLLNGQGDPNQMYWDSSTWLVVEVPDATVVDLSGFVKFESATILAIGTHAEMSSYLINLGYLNVVGGDYITCLVTVKKSDKTDWQGNVWDVTPGNTTTASNYASDSDPSHGLTGLAWGSGNQSIINYGNQYLWLLVSVCATHSIDGYVKFSAAKVIDAGEQPAISKKLVDRGIFNVAGGFYTRCVVGLHRIDNTATLYDFKGNVWNPVPGNIVTNSSFDGEPTDQNGFFGLASGNGNGGILFYDSTAVWVLVDVCTTIKLDGFVKFGSALVVDSGSPDAMAQALVDSGYTFVVNGKYGADAYSQASSGDYGRVVGTYFSTAFTGKYGTSIVDDRGTAISGDFGSSKSGVCGFSKSGYRGSSQAGDYGTAEAGTDGRARTGYNGTIKLWYFDSDKNHYLFKAEVAELDDGDLNNIRAGHFYSLNQYRQFVLSDDQGEII
jgi:hypothetical protein